MAGFIDEIVAAARPPSVNERRQLALLALDLAEQCMRAGDLEMATAYLKDAELHLCALIRGVRG